MRYAQLGFTALLALACTRPPGSSVPARIASQSGSIKLADTRVFFASTRDQPEGDLLGATEVYVMSGEGTNPVRLTNNDSADFFASLSPDRKNVVFDSNRLRAGAEPRNVSDLFLMNVDGTNQRHLIRGSSATWSPDGKRLAFHASASGSGGPISGFPGAATSDSDIFVMNVDDYLSRGVAPRNLTRNSASIDDDPDWSPDGGSIVFTSHPLADNPVDAVSAEIYVIDVEGGAAARRLTTNQEEERAPVWSSDGSRIVFCCRGGGTDFEICVMNADGSGQVRLTDNEVADLTPSWSPDGKKIVFHRAVAGRGSLQLIVMNSDGTGQTQWTDKAGQSAFPIWSE